MYRFLVTPRWLGGLAAALAVAAVMVLLGLWQFSRYETRSEINGRIDAAEVAEPVPVDALLASPATGQRLGPAPDEGAVWSPVSATGRYDPAYQILVRGRSLQGKVGYEVVTPLVLADGSAVLVDRGWLPAAGTARPEPSAVPPPPGGEVTVVGHLRRSESRSTPVEEIDGVRQSRRIVAAEVAPLVPYPVRDGYVQLIRQTPPLDGLTPVPAARENAMLNAAYAVQWWIFAGLVLGGYGWLARREARQRRQPTEDQRRQPAAERRRQPADAGESPPAQVPAGAE